MTSRHRLLALAPIALLSAFASAQVAYNSFGPANGGFDYDTGTGWTVTGAATGESIESGEQFTSLAGGVVADVILPLGYISGTGTFQVQLDSDNAGLVGGALETWTMAPSGTFGGYFAPTVLLGNGSASLVNGATYWLVVSASNELTSNLAGEWNWSNTGANLNLEQTFGGSTTYFGTEVAAAFEVDLGPSGTPEPFTMALGLAGIGIAVRRRASKA